MTGTITPKMRQFLKERNLLKAYRKYSTIRKKEKFEIRRDESRISVVAYRKGRYTYIAREYDYEVLARTKYSVPKAKALISSRKQRIIKIKASSWEDTAGQTVNYGGTNAITDVSQIKLKSFKRDKFNNFYREHSDQVRKRRGMVVLNITFYAQLDHKGMKQTVEAESGKDFNLKTSFDEAWQRAFRRCAAQVSFSWKDFRVNSMHYAYNYGYSDEVRRGF